MYADTSIIRNVGDIYIVYFVSFFISAAYRPTFRPNVYYCNAARVYK